MKRILTCPYCTMEEAFYAELQEQDNDGVYEFTCSLDHQNIVRMQQQKFELLFDNAILALIDGYPREVVTSGAASLERFYEFYIRVVAVKHKVNQSDFIKAWKLIDNQSERQLGAYMMFYLIENEGEEIPIIDDVKPNIEGVSKSNTRTWKSFRNTVVHKGYLPTMKEARVYLELIYNHILELTHHLIANYREDVLSASMQISPKLVALLEEKQTSMTSVNIPGMLNFNPYIKNECTFNEALESFQQFTIPRSFSR